VLAPLFMIVVAILPIPAEIPAMLNGMVFGTTVGTGITWGGGLVGAAISFEIARRFGRPLAERLLPERTLGQVDRVADSAGWPGLLVLRLIPVIAFTAINWGAGCTSVRRFTFLWTTALGILPGALVFTLSGAGLAWFYRTNPEFTPLVIVALLLVVGMTVFRFRQSGHAKSATSRPSATRARAAPDSTE
jgi:uncharacterized membrane protein YdjX (TVP38/TMEM64 family)